VSTAKGNKTYSSNLDLNVDVTIRNNKSAIRKIEENSHQPIGGNTNISIKTTADYVLSDRVNLQLFYDRVVTKYEVANSYNQINSNFGVKLRFSFGS
jgi:cell surface protein SprA